MRNMTLSIIIIIIIIIIVIVLFDLISKFDAARTESAFWSTWFDLYLCN